MKDRQALASLIVFGGKERDGEAVAGLPRRVLDGRLVRGESVLAGGDIGKRLVRLA